MNTTIIHIHDASVTDQYAHAYCLIFQSALDVETITITILLYPSNRAIISSDSEVGKENIYS